MAELVPLKAYPLNLTIVHSERPKLYGVMGVLSAVGLRYLH